MRDDNTEALPPLERAIDGYLDGYVLEGDRGYHLPTEHEKLIVKDAIMGLLEEPEFRAALAQRQQALTTAWLVEWRFNGVQWLYLWPSAPGGFSFTSNASKALRFARREDAEAALQWARDTDAALRPIGSLSRHGLSLGEMLVTEHEWPALTAAPSAQAGPSDDWQHLKQYGYAPGGYMSKCHRCGATPIMDKRAVTCRPCAETMHNEAKGL